MRALLMLDFETTALDVEGLAVLEAAWAVCDVNGAQRSETQQRFTAIPPQTRGGFAVIPGRPANAACARTAGPPSSRYISWYVFTP